MKTNQIVAAIDIGSAHIIAALADISPDGQITPLAFAEVPSKGVKKGGVANIGLVQHAIDMVLDELQIDGSYHIHSIIASLSGVSIIGHNADGTVEVRGNQVTLHNVMQAVAAAQSMSTLEGRQLLHILRQDFIVDRQTDIDDPIGLMGEKLSVRVHVISAAKTAYYNLLQVFSHRDIDVDNVIAGGLASALAVTTPDERQLGVCVLDIGAGTTDISVIYNGVIRHTEVIQLGGEMITGDIAFFMRSTVENAETVKRQLSVHAAYLPEETVEMPGLSEVARRYAKHDIANVARERCEQLVEMVVQKLSRAGVEDSFPGGFVVCGGSANIEGLAPLIMQKTQLPARIAEVEVVLPKERLVGSRFATIMGLFLWAYEEDFTRNMTNEAKTGIIYRLSESLKNISQRLRKQF